MLKLKYLFNNKDLVHMLLNNWENDNEDFNSLNYYRISSNAVYWCKNKGNTFFLRFVPAEEKSKESILAELDFLRFLRNSGYPAVDTILSKTGNELEVTNTPWGIYYAVAFKEVCGKPLDEMPLTQDIIFGWGKALGKLHKLSSEYIPLNNKRNDWKKTMDWVEEVLSNFPDEIAAKSELSMLKDYLLKLPTTKDNFGIIHYDFESDNVFYDEITKTYSPIDFDDAIYHWYSLDIAQTLDSIEDEIPEEQVASATNQFINGYRSEYHVSDDMLKLLPIFKRYINLYGYVRVLRSIEEKWNNEPEWMVNLRIKLDNLLTRRKYTFSKPI
ncbi:phosphotransferase [Clostridium chromiireducens]|uniref:Phosphotransferase n=1 Tax=Clostridium chromiireducens TaxID=225345 RepID=A0A964RMY8_9CLOT|nr:phosphotransferase [Clostridium chromiireducens]MVX64563.1 phosphotransferase [Clostridium chromiireducens]